MKALAQIGAWHNSLDQMPAVILVSPLLNYFFNYVRYELSKLGAYVLLESFKKLTFNLLFWPSEEVFWPLTASEFKKFTPSCFGLHRKVFGL